MTRRDETFVRLLARRFGAQRQAPLLRQLMEAGALDRRQCERWALRESVEERVRAGAGRCSAMEQTAEAYGCSYEKVRKICYER